MERVVKNINEAKNLMNIAIYTGYLLVKNGAEIYRAEDTVQRICSSLKNTKSTDAYVLPSGIFVSLEYKGEIITIFKKIKGTSTNLSKIDKLNTFSRNFTAGLISIEDGMEILKKIENDSGLKQYKINISAGVAGSFFSLLFGGTLKDFICALFITAFMSFILDKISIFGFSYVIDNFIGAFIASVMAIFASKIGFGDHHDMIIIGAIMILVPGISATKAIRDIFNGDFLSGIMELTKAIFLALGIALGVGIALKLFI